MEKRWKYVKILKGLGMIWARRKSLESKVSPAVELTPRSDSGLTFECGKM